MSLLDILICPDERLRRLSEPVTVFDAALKRQANDLLETMYAAPGIGLAAPQCGILQRMLVVDIAEEGEKRQPFCLINPQIIKSSAETSVYKEGCLSVPEQYAEVTRPAEVLVRYQDVSGAEKELQAAGLLSTCVQHEIDHLNGVLFIDYLSRVKRDMLLRKLQKLRRDEG